MDHSAEFSKSRKTTCYLQPREHAFCAPIPSGLHGEGIPRDNANRVSEGGELDLPLTDQLGFTIALPLSPAVHPPHCSATIEGKSTELRFRSGHEGLLLFLVLSALVAFSVTALGMFNRMDWTIITPGLVTTGALIALIVVLSMIPRTAILTISENGVRYRPVWSRYRTLSLGHLEDVRTESTDIVRLLADRNSIACYISNQPDTNTQWLRDQVLLAVARTRDPAKPTGRYR
jgi:hypothetical protein